MIVYMVTRDEQNQRLDKLLAKYLNTAPKSLIYKLMRKRVIKLNARPVKGPEILREGDVIQFFISDDTHKNLTKEKNIIDIKKSRPVTVVFEDRNILICDKEIGLLSHPESPDDDDTLLHRIQYYLHEKGEFDNSRTATFTPAICNRLDRNTGGLVIAGKNYAAVRALNQAIAGNKIKKYYKTLVVGELQGRKVLQGYHIKKKDSNQVKIFSMPVIGAKEVVTEYSAIKNFKEYTLLEVRLWSGKSHQIRAHLAAVGHPVVGDRKYGDKSCNNFFSDEYMIRNQMLHADKIIFGDMSEELAYLSGKQFECLLPEDFNKVIETLRPL